VGAKGIPKGAIKSTWGGPSRQRRKKKKDAPQGDKKGWNLDGDSPGLSAVGKGRHRGREGKGFLKKRKKISAGTQSRKKIGIK